MPRTRAPVEIRRLERNRVQHRAGASAPLRFRFGLAQQSAAEAAAAQRFRQVKEVDEEETERRSAGEPAQDLAGRGIGHVDIERCRVAAARHRVVEFAELAADEIAGSRLFGVGELKGNGGMRGHGMETCVNEPPNVQCS
ncbi:hypothetical protein WS48_29045 [Burkholderia sp. RF7-non_BP1]|nr:hypothetical protein WS48_29045 [Burkholderia sp. RF7-non_BP1]KUY94254.1 hypothetical protein WS49_24955 [Burkholderia sp. RF7-non_BP4]